MFDHFGVLFFPTEGDSTMEPLAGNKLKDLRDWVDLANHLGKLKHFSGVDWDLEIGGLTELMLQLHPDNTPCLLFDNIKGYPPGWRVMTNAVAGRELAAAALGLPTHLTPTELVQTWRNKSKHMRLMPVQEVKDGPVLETVLSGANIDLSTFPTPRWHESDGGRYLGTGDIVITRDPESGQINVGTYRMMVLGHDEIGLYISPGKQGRLHRDKYFARGEPMPVAAAFGMDPLLLVAGGENLPSSTNEYEWVGAVKDQPVEVVRGSVTGLPIPAHAEIAVEGFVYPDRLKPEGPFGEFTGYYASRAREEPYLQVKALYHRRDPIILGYQPTRPPGAYYHTSAIIKHALIWDALEAAGVPEIKSVARLPSAGPGFLVISIAQQYAGHAKQAAMVAAQCRAGAYLGRYIIVVEEDIDPYNTDEVLWALWTRSDPEESAEVIRNCWSTPLDPRISPEKRASGDFTNSRLIIDATRPFHWRKEFPPVGAANRDLLANLRSKWKDALF